MNALFPSINCRYDHCKHLLKKPCKECHHECSKHRKKAHNYHHHHHQNHHYNQHHHTHPVHSDDNFFEFLSFGNFFKNNQPKDYLDDHSYPFPDNPWNGWSTSHDNWNNDNFDIWNTHHDHLDPWNYPHHQNNHNEEGEEEEEEEEENDHECSMECLFGNCKFMRIHRYLRCKFPKYRCAFRMMNRAYRGYQNLWRPYFAPPPALVPPPSLFSGPAGAMLLMNMTG